MTDEQMTNYITSYGDRIAVLSFCQQSTLIAEKDTLLQNLRDKIGARKMRSRTKRAVCSTSGLFQMQGVEMARGRSKAAGRTLRKIEIGWLHFHIDEYQQVRTRNGGGTRHATVDKSTTVSQILEMGKELFFPDGTSTKGVIEDFLFEVCDFKKNLISLDETVGNLYEKTKLKLLRFYMCTKKEETVQYSSEEDCQSPEQPNDMDSTPTARKGSFGEMEDCDDQTLNHLDSSYNHSGVVDFTDPPHSGSTPRQPQPFSSENSGSVPHMDEGDTVVWNPEEDLIGLDDDSDIVVVTLNYDNTEEVVQDDLSSPFGHGSPILLPSARSLFSPQMQTSNMEAGQTGQDSGLIPPEDSHPSSSGLLPQSVSAGNSENLANHLHVSIRRIKVVEDLLAVFMENNLLNQTLKMEFVNERAIDDAGVSREVYTAFWEQFLEQCEGETERVPRLRPDFCESEWQAIGHIWVKGFLDHGVIPVRLSKAFILACVHGIESVDDDVLIPSFLNYLPLVERSAVEKALQGTMDQGDEEDLLDLFTRMGSHFLPPNENIQQAIETMAHKAILQEPKYILDCFSTSMACVQVELADKKSLLSLYEKKKASGKRLLQLFESANVTLSQREQTTFNHLQRFVKNADEDKAEKILRFCTGSSVICVDKILICFNTETGLNRRPVARTCGATLELPCTYSSYPDFRTEFDNILSSNYFEMDII
ncbi:uncharacterized protein LOC116721178 [Xiphophorus hellerii]|uniref:uncharacterized protein LOC116713524 n=1 Tax=Xiphophorus hellerii TaxID=8084 RepID=UPI0013B3ADDF|nr:uncharacterized protein LOC116713524 [Xiphophorus hellerii]XP_032420630.1 uncharacterized protein LOC116721178 [Xiphophorus hellerii]